MTLGVVAGLARRGSPLRRRAQDYRARVQGSVADDSSGALPGATVTLRNDATGVAVDRVTDAEGRYIFDFVEPGHVHRSPPSCRVQAGRAAERARAAARRRHRRPDAGGRRRRGDGRRRSARRSRCSSTPSSSDITLERELIDQVPITGRNPYNLANLDPTMSTRRARRAARTGRITTPTPTTTTPAAARAAPTTSCSTACRSAPASRPPTRRRWTRSKRSPSRRTASTPRTATAWAASSA